MNASRNCTRELEERHDDAEAEAEHAENSTNRLPLLVLAAEDEDEQHEVASEHVVEQSKERQRPDEEVGRTPDEHDRLEPAATGAPAT